MKQTHLAFSFVLLLVACAACSDFSSEFTSKDPDVRISYAQKMFEAELQTMNPTKACQDRPANLFSPGTIDPLWLDAQITDNVFNGMVNVEVPTMTDFLLEATQTDPVSGYEYTVQCRPKLLVTSTIDGDNGVFLTFFIPAIIDLKSGKNSIMAYDNSGDMHNFSGTKVYTKIDGSIVRINKYLFGHKVSGIYVSGAKTSADKNYVRHNVEMKLKYISFRISSRSLTRGDDGNPDPDPNTLPPSYCYGDTGEGDEDPGEDGWGDDNPDPDDGDGENDDDEWDEDGEDEWNEDDSGLQRDEIDNYLDNLLRTNSQLSAAERQFIIAHPVAAFIFYNNATIASTESRDRFGTTSFSQRDGLGDAFRHVYWSAMNAYDCGANLARQFGNAHEEEYDPVQTPAGAEMDYHNNEIGYAIGMEMRESGASEEDILGEVLEAIASGQCIIINTESEGDEE